MTQLTSFALVILHETRRIRDQRVSQAFQVVVRYVGLVIVIFSRSHFNMLIKISLAVPQIEGDLTLHFMIFRWRPLTVCPCRVGAKLVIFGFAFQFVKVS